MGETDEELKKLATIVGSLIENDRKNGDHNDWLKIIIMPAITVVFSAFGALSIFYSSTATIKDELAKLQSNDVRLETRQEGIFVRLATLEAWREQTTANRFTAAEGAALRTAIDALRAELTSVNTAQDNRLTAINAANQERFSQLQSRVFDLETRATPLKRSDTKTQPQQGDSYGR